MSIPFSRSRTCTEAVAGSGVQGFGGMDGAFVARCPTDHEPRGARADSLWAGAAQRKGW